MTTADPHHHHPPPIPLTHSHPHFYSDPVYYVVVVQCVCVSEGLLADAGGRARPVPPAVSEPQTRWPANWSAPRTVPVLSKIKADELNALRPSACKYKYQLPLVSALENAFVSAGANFSLSLSFPLSFSRSLSLCALFALPESYGASICRDETQRKTQKGGKDFISPSISSVPGKKKKPTLIII